MSDIAVVYLARAAAGLDPVDRFVRSYRANPAGMAHDLVVIFKGHDDAAFNEAVRYFVGLPHYALRVSDDGFDIGAYLHAASVLDHDKLCFLNTFTEIAATDWLGLLAEPLRHKDVGIVGAMGSYESVRDTIDFVAAATWLCMHEHVAYDPQLAWQFEWIFKIYAQPWLAQSRYRSWRSRIRSLLRPTSAGNIASRRAFWKQITGYPGALSEWLDSFPQFPNPHIRSNGFAIRRQLLNTIVSSCPPTKETAMQFESGVDGYTARIHERGLRAIVAGKDGRQFDDVAWPSSNTFRLGRQDNLILTDNQSRGFDAMSEGSRLTHVRVTWGDYAGPAPHSFKNLGFAFARAAPRVFPVHLYRAREPLNPPATLVPGRPAEMAGSGSA